MNRTVFRQVFRYFVILCRHLDLFGRELLAVDGTWIKAVNNRDRNFTRRSLEKFNGEADEKLSDYMKRLGKADAEEDASGADSDGSGRGQQTGRELAAIKGKLDRHKAFLDKLDSTGDDQISLTDPGPRYSAHDQGRRRLQCSLSTRTRRPRPS